MSSTAELSGKEKLRHAKNCVDYAECFWGADAQLYGTHFANKSAQEAEMNLRRVASEIIEGVKS